MVDGKGIGKAPVDKLSVRIKGVYCGQENIHQGIKGHPVSIIFDADGFPVGGSLMFYVLIAWICFLTAGIAADHTCDARQRPEGRRNAPETSAGKISFLHLTHNDPSCFLLIVAWTGGILKWEFGPSGIGAPFAKNFTQFITFPYLFSADMVQ